MTKYVKRPVSFLLAILMVVGIFTAMPITANAASGLLWQRVWYFNREYTIIEDHSNGYNSGYVTLLPTEYIALSPFDERDPTTVWTSDLGYAHSTVKRLLDSMVQPGGLLEKEAFAMRTVNVADEGVYGVKCYLLNATEAKRLPQSVLDDGSYVILWLRDTDEYHKYASDVGPGNDRDGEHGFVREVGVTAPGNKYPCGTMITTVQGVRPVFQIDLSKAPYDAEHHALLYSVNMTYDSTHISTDATINYLKTDLNQRGMRGEITPVKFTTHSGYVFPETSELYKTVNGVTIARTADNEITVSGSITGNVDVQIPEDVVPIPATAPTITGQPARFTMSYKESGREVTISATAAEGHTLRYQWYRNTVDSNTGGSPMGNLDYIYIYGHNRTPVGTYYYYCIVTATREDNGQTASVVSDVATVVVTKPEGTFCYDYYHTSTEKYVDDEDFTQDLYFVGDSWVNYTSSNPEVATVNASTGSVTMVSTGVTTITATLHDSSQYSFSSNTTSYTLTVKKCDGSISYNTTEIAKYPDDAAFTNPLTIVGDGSVSYASSNTNVATVDAATGEVTIVAAGKATITATTADTHTYAYATKKASYTLNVNKRTPFLNIVIHHKSVTYGDPVFWLTAYTDSGGALSYEVISGDSVTVDEHGNVTIVKLGATQVRVTSVETDVYAQATDIITVTVNKAPAYAATVTNVNRYFDGTAKPLVTVDESTLVGGTMQYALGTSAAAVPESGWSEDIPTGTEPGAYYVWSKVVPDDVHAAPDPTVVTSVIGTYYIERAYENGEVTQTRHDLPYDVTFLNENNIPSELSEGWYVVNGDVSCEHIDASGDIHLVLMDGKTLTVSNGFNVDGTLSVYCQESGSGRLNVVATFRNNGAAIGGEMLTIHGGSISANGQGDNPGIGSNTVTIYAGTLNACGENLPGISSNTFTIYGGTVTMQNTRHGMGIGNGKLILGSGVGLVDGDGYSLAEPSDQEQVVTARDTFMKTGIGKTPEPLNYKSASFNESTGQVEFTENTISDYRFMTATQTTWSSGWYVVEKNVTNTGPVTIDGTVNLIILDGVTLTLNCTIALDGDNTLNIYGGEQGTGKLSIEKSFPYRAGIGCDYYRGILINAPVNIGGTLAVHGCEISVNGDIHGTPGIGIQNVTIYGGNVKATGFGGAGIGSAIGFDYDGTVKIYGGDVTAVSKNDENGTKGSGIGVGAGGNDSSTLIIGAGIGLIDEYRKTIVEPQGTLQTVTARKSTMKTGVGVELEPVSYMENGTEKSCEVYKLFDASTTDLEDGWYIVSGTVTVSNRISVSRDASIILCDGAELICEKGIALTAGNTLSIYGQTEGTGKLTAASDQYKYAAIGADYSTDAGELKVYGGQIYATSGNYSTPAVGANNRNSGSLYIAGGKLVFANSNGGRALQVATVTMESGIKMYQSTQPDPEETGEEVNQVQLEHGDFSRAYVTIVSASAANPDDPGHGDEPVTTTVPTVARLTPEMVEDMHSLVGDMPADFTKIDEEIG